MFFSSNSVVGSEKTIDGLITTDYCGCVAADAYGAGDVLLVDGTGETD